MAWRSVLVMRPTRPVLMMAAISLLAGCATVPERPAEEVVKARAQARWDAVVKGDFDTAYSFFGPGTKAVNSLDTYKASVNKDFYKSGQVEKVTCEADACEVQVRVEYVFKGSRFKTPLGETWIRQQGNWWYVLK
jgi:esterase/lipase superfamily enzyme